MHSPQLNATVQNQIPSVWIVLSYSGKLNSVSLADWLVISSESDSFLPSLSYCRSDPHTATRRGQQVSFLLPNSAHGTQGGGIPGTIPWSNHPPGQTDPQHCYHDVHLWSGGLPAWPLTHQICLLPVKSGRQLASDWERCLLASVDEKSKWRPKETEDSLVDQERTIGKHRKKEIVISITTSSSLYQAAGTDRGRYMLQKRK